MVGQVAPWLFWIFEAPSAPRDMSVNSVDRVQSLLLISSSILLSGELDASQSGFQCSEPDLMCSWLNWQAFTALKQIMRAYIEGFEQVAKAVYKISWVDLVGGKQWAVGGIANLDYDPVAYKDWPMAAIGALGIVWFNLKALGSRERRRQACDY